MFLLYVCALIILSKLAHKQWKEAGKPKRPEHPLLLHKVETRKIYRTEIRKEESKRKQEERDKIINAQSYNKKIFYQMIRKQRNNKNIIVEDLYVGNLPVLIALIASFNSSMVTTFGIILS
jgi:hypothetical protein